MILSVYTDHSQQVYGYSSTHLPVESFFNLFMAAMQFASRFFSPIYAYMFLCIGNLSMQSTTADVHEHLSILFRSFIYICTYYTLCVLHLVQALLTITSKLLQY